MPRSSKIIQEVFNLSQKHFGINWIYLNSTIIQTIQDFQDLIKDPPSAIQDENQFGASKLKARSSLEWKPVRDNETNPQESSSKIIRQ